MTQKTTLLIWDAPNMDMGLGAILGGRPNAQYRPRFDAIGKWLATIAQEEHTNPQGAIFTNITPGSSEVIRPWIDAVRNVGFAVFAKPKIEEESDVDEDMSTCLEDNKENLAHVIVASADGRNFLEQLNVFAALGVKVTVLGFYEHATWAVNAPNIEFVDIEEIEGVFREPLPRISLDSLPEEGAWLQPFRPLTHLLEDTESFKD